MANRGRCSSWGLGEERVVTCDIAFVTSANCVARPLNLDTVSRMRFIGSVPLTLLTRMQKLDNDYKRLQAKIGQDRSPTRG